MVAYQRRGDVVGVKFRTPGEVLRWSWDGAEVESVEGEATHFMVWLDGRGNLCGSGGGLLPRRDGTEVDLVEFKVEYLWRSNWMVFGGRVAGGGLKEDNIERDLYGGLDKVELGAIYEVGGRDEWALGEDLKKVYFQEYDSVVHRDSNAAGVAARRAIYDLGVATGLSAVVGVKKELEREVAKVKSLDEVASKLVGDLDSLRVAIAPHMEEVLAVKDLRDIVLKREEMRLEGDKRVASLMEEVRRLEGEVLRLSEEREELGRQVEMKVTPVVPEVEKSDIFPWLMGLVVAAGVGKSGVAGLQQATSTTPEAEEEVPSEVLEGSDPETHRGELRYMVGRGLT